jgi:phage protein D
VAAKSALTHDADDDALGGELEDGDSGASVLRQALGERKESVAHGVPFTGDEAKYQAESAFRLGARRFLRGCGIAEPETAVSVGMTVDLVGLGPLFSGKYYVCETRHRFDGKKGLRTEFICERPWIGKS